MAPSPVARAGFFEVERSPRDGPRDDDPSSAIRLALSGPQRVVAGREMSLALTLTNDGGADLRYARAVDGSFEHWRSPFVDLYARDERSGRVYRWARGAGVIRCGNVNPRTADDYLTLGAGQQRPDPFGEWSQSALSPVLAEPGRYTLWVVYAACAGPELGGGLEVDVAPPADLFQGTLVSNAIAVVVTPP